MFTNAKSLCFKLDSRWFLRKNKHFFLLHIFTYFLESNLWMVFAADENLTEPIYFRSEQHYIIYESMLFSSITYQRVYIQYCSTTLLHHLGVDLVVVLQPLEVAKKCRKLAASRESKMQKWIDVIIYHCREICCSKKVHSLTKRKINSLTKNNVVLESEPWDETFSLTLLLYKIWINFIIRTK